MTRVLRQIDEVRQGTALIQVQTATGEPCAGIGMAAEQVSHAFRFSGVLPDLSSFSPIDRQRCLDRAQEVFNHTLFPGDPWPTKPDLALADLSREDAARLMPLGRLRSRLDQFSAGGQQLLVLVSGNTAGMSLPCKSSLPDREMGQRVANLYLLCFSHAAVQEILWTGFSDREPAVAGHGLLRVDLSPTCAFQMLRKLVGTVWHSRAGGWTDRAGQFRFRGFYGDYRVAAGEAPAQIRHFSLSRQDPSTWSWRLDESRLFS